jgi:hypothetical protein
MPAPDTVKSLVERFERNHEQYRSSKYNETQARRDKMVSLVERMLDLHKTLTPSAGRAEGVVRRKNKRWSSARSSQRKGD